MNTNKTTTSVDPLFFKFRTKLWDPKSEGVERERWKKKGGMSQFLDKKFFDELM